MRKLLLALFILVIVCVTGAFGFVWYTFHTITSRDISVEIRDTDDSYRLSAKFDRHHSGRVHRYLYDELHNDLFRHENIDADLTLDDQTQVHIFSKPGRISIRLNKHENGSDAYSRIKQLEEGIKYRLTDPN